MPLWIFSRNRKIFCVCSDGSIENDIKHSVQKKQLVRKIDLTSSAIVSDHIVVHKPLVRLISLSIWTCFSRLSYCFGFVWLFVWILFQLALRSVSMFAVCFIFLHHFCIARAEWNSIHVHDHDRYWYIFQHAIDRFRLFSIH